MRVLIHAQHLSGVGHHVRGLELARALLARGHEVACVEGGRAVPRAPLDGDLLRLQIPVLRRKDGTLGGADADAPLAELLAERRRRLVEHAAGLAPHVLVVEHWPFSKWELEDEFLALAAAVRAARPGARVVCSVRDVCAQTPHERVPPDAWCARVAERLAAHVDAVLVHADPAFTRIDEHLLPADALDVPVFHTGFVSQPVPAAAPDCAGRDVLSSGGGRDDGAFLSAAVAAWRAAPRARGGRLVVFPGLFAEFAERAVLEDAAAAGGVELRAFGTDFLGCLAAARLSIGRAGYNTCTNLLATRRRAVLVPDRRMSDQAPRAARLAARGLAVMPESGLPDGEATGCAAHRSGLPGVEALAAAIDRALAGPEPRHDLDLDGAARSAEILAGLAGGG